jgi:hypothetical protein
MSATFLPKIMGISYRDMVTPEYFQCPCPKFVRYSEDHRLAYFDISPLSWSCTDSRSYDLASVHIVRQDLSHILDQWGKKVSDVEIITCPIRYNFRWPWLYPLHYVISVAGSDLYLAGRREARFSLDADLGLKIMVFDWREMLISILARAKAL